MGIEEFYTRLFEVLQKKEWTIYRLSLESDLSPNTLYNMKRRRTEPKMVTFLKIIAGLKMSPDEFVFGTEEESIEESWLEQLEFQYNLNEEEKKSVSDVVKSYIEHMRKDA